MMLWIARLRAGEGYVVLSTCIGFAGQLISALSSNPKMRLIPYEGQSLRIRSGREDAANATSLRTVRQSNIGFR